MQRRGQECVHKFRENFSQMHTVKKDESFYILKMLYLVYLVQV